MIQLQKQWIKCALYIALASVSCLLFSAFTPPLLTPAAAARFPVIGALDAASQGTGLASRSRSSCSGSRRPSWPSPSERRPPISASAFTRPCSASRHSGSSSRSPSSSARFGRPLSDLGAFYPYSRDLVLRVRESGIAPFVGHYAAYFFLYYVPWEFFFRGFLIFPFALAAEREARPPAPARVRRPSSSSRRYPRPCSISAIPSPSWRAPSPRAHFRHSSPGRPARSCRDSCCTRPSAWARTPSSSSKARAIYERRPPHPRHRRLRLHRLPPVRGPRLPRRPGPRALPTKGAAIRAPRAERTRGAGPGEVELFRADLGDGARVREAVAGVGAVIHAAALASDWGPLELFIEANYDATVGLLEAARAAGLPRPSSISAPPSSTASGPMSTRPSDGPYYPLKYPYQITKLMTEEYVLAQNAPGFRTTAIRPCNVYGPGDRMSTYQMFDAIMDGLIRLHRHRERPSPARSTSTTSARASWPPSIDPSRAARPSSSPTARRSPGRITSASCSPRSDPRSGR